MLPFFNKTSVKSIARWYDEYDDKKSILRGKWIGDPKFDLKYPASRHTSFTHLAHWCQMRR